MDYTELVMELLETKREDDYWDFKETWHNNKADLIHDIICLSNNRVDRDAYLMMGIRDKTYEIIGIENDENRKTQQNVIDLLNEVSFISGIRPSIDIMIYYFVCFNIISFFPLFFRFNHLKKLNYWRRN